MALTQGLLAALIADSALAKVRGNAFDFFNLVSGVALLAASAPAGVLRQSFGARGTFMAGSVFAGVVVLGRVAGNSS